MSTTLERPKTIDEYEVVIKESEHATRIHAEHDRAEAALQRLYAERDGQSNANASLEEQEERRAAKREGKAWKPAPIHLDAILQNAIKDRNDFLILKNELPQRMRTARQQAAREQAKTIREETKERLWELADLYESVIERSKAFKEEVYNPNEVCFTSSALPNINPVLFGGREFDRESLFHKRIEDIDAAYPGRR